MTSERFTATVAAAERGHLLIPVPFAERIDLLAAGHKQRPNR